MVGGVKFVMVAKLNGRQNDNRHQRELKNISSGEDAFYDNFRY
jgi:hypothetical protein